MKIYIINAISKKATTHQQKGDLYGYDYPHRSAMFGKRYMA